jgi:hypothetical protein
MPGAGMPPAGGGSTGGAYQAPFGAPYQQPPYTPTPGYPPTPGFVDPNMPPGPPVHPAYWRRKEPIGAIILIALGLLFLIGEWSGDILKFTWPVLLIGLGVWLVIRQMGTTKGGPQ